jgi:hypothetical protein
MHSGHHQCCCAVCLTHDVLVVFCTHCVTQVAQSVRERLDDLTALRISGLKEETELHALVAQARDWEAAVTTAFTTAEQQPTDADIQQFFESGKAVLASPLMFEALRWRVDTSAALRAVDATTATTAGAGAADTAATAAGHDVSALQELVARGTALLSSATDSSSSSSASSSTEQQSASTAAASAAVAAVVQAAVTPALQGLEVALWRVTAAEALTADSDDTSLQQAEQLLQRAAAAALVSPTTATAAAATTAAASPEYAALTAAVQEKRTAEAAAAAALQRALSVSVGIGSEEGAHELDTAAGVLKQALQQFRGVHEQLRSDVEDW